MMQPLKITSWSNGMFTDTEEEFGVAGRSGRWPSVGSTVTFSPGGTCVTAEDSDLSRISHGTQSLPSRPLSGTRHVAPVTGTALCDHPRLPTHSVTTRGSLPSPPGASDRLRL